MQRFAAVILVDARGWLLLQERDDQAPIDPDRWGLVGGHIEADETEDEAVHRELLEETGLRDHRLERWRTFTGDSHLEPTSPPWHMTVYAAATTVTDADVVCGEGRQIVFVEPGDTPALPMTAAAGVVVPAFLASPRYAILCP